MSPKPEVQVLCSARRRLPAEGESLSPKALKPDYKINPVFCSDKCRQDFGNAKRAVFPKAHDATPVVKSSDATTKPADPLSKAEGVDMPYMRAGESAVNKSFITPAEEA